MEQTKITIEAIISADVNKVWDYWTRPEHITKWNFASDDWHCPSAENDLRTGGKFSSRMEAKDGSMGFDFGGVYDEVIDKKKIAYTMGDGRKVTTIFEDLGDKNRVTTTFDAEKLHSAEFQKQGWQAILNNFRKYTESN